MISLSLLIVRLTEPLPPPPNKVEIEFCSSLIKSLNLNEKSAVYIVGSLSLRLRM